MGFYDGVATHSFNHDPKVGFWDNARKLHARLQDGFTDETLLKEPLTRSLLSPAILDAINFKKLGSLVRRRLADPASSVTSASGMTSSLESSSETRWKLPTGSSSERRSPTSPHGFHYQLRILGT